MKSTIIFTLSIIVVLSISITSISAEPLIPEWIRNNAAWWAEGAIDDSTFVQGIEFLIQEGIMQIPPTVQGSSSSSNDIPPWIRNNAAWWAEGIISNSDFVKGIEFLVNSGIISVKQTTQTQIDSPSLEIDVDPNDDSVEIMQETWRCSGNARCFTGVVTSVIDGDTIKIDGKSIRFAMASAPELNELGGIEARNFIETICPVGSIATVDEDDGQTQGSYGRILGIVYCNGINLNADLLDVGHGYLISDFCEYSEFENEYWAQKHGCSNSSEPQCPASHPYLWSDGLCYDATEFLDNGCPRNHPYLWSDGLCYDATEFLDNGCPRNHPYLWSDGLCYNVPEPVYEEPVESEPQCDPSYPDFCIPPPPPDLDCGDISQKNFTVLQPDPHRFDGDKDGIGCESR